MNANINWLDFQRADSAAVIEFLVSSAAAFAELNLLSLKDSDDLRASIRNLQKSAQESLSPLTLLEAERNDFLSMMLNRYGKIGLSLNLFRMTLIPHLSKSNCILSTFGKSVLERSQLFFNKAFYIYAGGVCERKTLLSSVLLEVASTISGVSTSIQSVSDEVSHMLPADLADYTTEDYETDQVIATHLGFCAIRADVLPFRTENLIRRKISDALLSLTDTVVEFEEQYRYNMSLGNTAQINIVCDWLKAEAHRISNISFPKNGDLSAFELRRFNFNSTIETINSTLEILSMEFISLLSSSSLSKEDQKLIPGTVHRQIATTLHAGGISVGDALNASQALVSYCKSQNITPKEIIPGELIRINPHLTIDSLKSLQEIDIDRCVSTKANEEKENIIKESSRLMKIFKERITKASSIIMIALISLSSSCGVKTAPRSDIGDFRPSLPFKDEPTERGDDINQASPQNNLKEK